MAALVMVIGFTAAPVAAAGDDVSLAGQDGISIGDIGGSDVPVDVDQDAPELPVDTETPGSDVEVPSDSVPDTAGSNPASDETGEPFPDAVCTDVPGEVRSNVPFEQVSPEQLPEQAQPSNIPVDAPLSLLTPRSLTGIAFGPMPNQCEVQDPNDPSIDPTNPPTSPGYDYETARMGQYGGGAVGLVYYEATLNESGEGPGVSGSVGGLANPSAQDGGFSVTVNDGEKDYSVSPHAHAEDASTGWGSVDVGMPFGSFGGNVDCNGAECQPGYSSLPKFAEVPAIPAPTS